MLLIISSSILPKNKSLTDVLSGICFLDEMPSFREGGRRSYACSQLRTSVFELTLTWKHWQSELLGKGGGNPLSWLGTLADLAWQKEGKERMRERKKGLKKKKKQQKTSLCAVSFILIWSEQKSWGLYSKDQRKETQNNLNAINLIGMAN